MPPKTQNRACVSVINQNCLLLIGVVLAAEKKEFSSLFVPVRESGKLYKMDDHMMVSVSGVVADANYLIDMGRVHCQRHLYSQC